MVVSVDREGGVVIPLAMRKRLILRAGSELDIALRGDSIVLTPRRAGRAITIAADGLPLLSRVDAAPVTDADVQTWRDADQR